MSDPTPAEGPWACYRHPDRLTYVRCQRCERPICAACQTPAAVGVQCPECVREGREAMNAAHPRARRVVNAVRRPGRRPIVTIGIIVVSTVMYILQWVLGDGFTNALIYAPVFTGIQPWRMVTSILVHSPTFIPHLVVNMLSLWFLGPTLEQVMGRWRFIALYVVSGFAGSVGVMLLASPTTAVLGASGAIFGIAGALLIIQRRMGGDIVPLIATIAINLAFGFFVSGIAWQAHVGGLVGGALLGLVMFATRRASRTAQVLAIAGFAAALVVVTIGWVLLTGSGAQLLR